VDVYNERLKRVERETLADLIATRPPMLNLETSFSQARQSRTVEVALGWLKLYLPGDE